VLGVGPKNSEEETMSRKNWTKFSKLKSLECTQYETLWDLVEEVVHFARCSGVDGLPVDKRSTELTEKFCQLQDARREER
jgi:hypothetical protein